MGTDGKLDIVVVDDDELFRPMLVGNLGAAGYNVVDYAAAPPALAAIVKRETPPDLLILDWKMPGMTGIELLRQLRAGGVVSPALFLTSLDDVIYEETALNEGAADFVGKTRSFTVLLRRVELVLAGHRSGAGAVAGEGSSLKVGGLELDAASHRVQWQGKPVELTLSEFRTVELLARAGRDIGYREIYDAMRGENFMAGAGPEGYRANVRALVKRIRQKFNDADPGFAAIVNYPGFGYRWQDPEASGGGTVPGPGALPSGAASGGRPAGVANGS